MDPDPARWTSTCPECSLRFPSDSLLATHIQQCHSSYTCYHCPLTFSDNDSFKSHLLTHGITEDTPGPKSICSVCNAVFPDNWHLTSHLRLHETGEIRAPKRRRRRPKGVPLGRISTIPTEVLTDPMGIARLPPRSENFEQFYENYTRVEELKPEAMEYYCGICGEGVATAKFATHILNHLHQIFELRKGRGLVEQSQAQENREGRECGECTELNRKVRDMLDVLDGCYYEGQDDVDSMVVWRRGICILRLHVLTLKP